jgi:hypothetical protein
MRLAPVMRLTLIGVGARHAERLAACRELERVTDLTLSGPPGLGDEGLSAFVASPHLGNLTTLELPNNDIHDRGVRSLAASPSITKLEALYLDINVIGAAGYRELAGSVTMKRLRSLSLPGASTRALPGYGCQEEEQALLDLHASLPLLTSAGLGQWRWSDVGRERYNELIRRRWASRQRG